MSLIGRTVRSHTLLKNTGGAGIPLQWFPHPFFPYPVPDPDGTTRLCKFNLDSDLQSKGFSMDDAGWVCRVAGEAGEEPGMGYLTHAHAAAPPLMALQNHPTVGMIAAKCSYCPTFFPIWGNGRAYSGDTRSKSPSNFPCCRSNCDTCILWSRYVQLGAVS